MLDFNQNSKVNNLPLTYTQGNDKQNENTFSQKQRQINCQIKYLRRQERRHMLSDEQGWNHRTLGLQDEKQAVVAWILTNLNVPKTGGAESNSLNETKDSGWGNLLVIWGRKHTYPHCLGLCLGDRKCKLPSITWNRKA